MGSGFPGVVVHVLVVLFLMVALLVTLLLLMGLSTVPLGGRFSMAMVFVLLKVGDDVVHLLSVFGVLLGRVPRLLQVMVVLGQLALVVQVVVPLIILQGLHGQGHGHQNSGKYNNLHWPSGAIKANELNIIKGD